MYGIAYVIIPTEFSSLQAALDEALAPFRRGGAGDLPRAKLAFDDVTDALRTLHAETITLTAGREVAGVAVVGGSAMTGDLDFEALRGFLSSTGAPTWNGRLADLEPDFDVFARRFTRWKARDPVTGGFGEWLNPLGRWDWWELGGRFDGLVSGQRRPGAGSEAMISSGPNKGRDLIGGVVRALGGKPSEIEAEIVANIDLVSSLLAAGQRGDEYAFPTAVVLPFGAWVDEFRWFDALGWRPIPQETKALLSVPDDANFNDAAMSAWKRFNTMAVAGVAYHF